MNCENGECDICKPLLSASSRALLNLIENGTEQTYVSILHTLVRTSTFDSFNQIYDTPLVYKVLNSDDKIDDSFLSYIQEKLQSFNRFFVMVRGTDGCYLGVLSPNLHHQSYHLHIYSPANLEVSVDFLISLIRRFEVSFDIKYSPFLAEKNFTCIENCLAASLLISYGYDTMTAFQEASKTKIVVSLLERLSEKIKND